MDWFTLVILFVVMGLGFKIYYIFSNPNCKSTKPLHGKTVLITGGTAGMGLEIAKDLARRGGKIIVACPFEDEGKTAEKIIRETSGNNNVFFKSLDLASLQSTRKFADEIKTEDRLDILINNAGAWLPFRITPDGMEMTMQINYYSHFLLTISLLSILKKTAKISEEPVRIINTSSQMHYYSRSSIHDFNKPSAMNIYNYIDSKLCVAIMTRVLAKKLMNTNIVVNTVCPGPVGTRIFENSTGKFFGTIWRILFFCFAKTPWDGCQTALHVALDKNAGGVSGEYFENSKILKPGSAVFDDVLAAELLGDTVRRVKLSEDELKCGLD